MNQNMGTMMFQLAQKLFPICRSITGEGVRQTLSELKAIMPSMSIHEIASGTDVFDWKIPKEWNIKDAYIEDMQGKRIISFQKNNLHIMGYSLPIDKIMTREQLLKIVYTQKDQPDVIPYVTSYYSEKSGFCMSEKQKASLKDEKYHVVIDSELKQGSLTYGEILLPGDSEKEIFFSTYICHPSMANNEISGLCVAIYLAKWLNELPRRYSYRFAFVPETIGALAYLNNNLHNMKKNILAGLVLSCVGDTRAYSYIESRYGNTLSDKVLKNILYFHTNNYKTYSFLQRGSDERQYCAPHIDLPVCTFCRSKFGEYPEYHTSADNLSVISSDGLDNSLNICQQYVIALEKNDYYSIKCMGEPQMGKRGLYPLISQKGSANDVQMMMDFIAYADGQNDLLDISNRIDVPVSKLIPIVEQLLQQNLLRVC